MSATCDHTHMNAGSFRATHSTTPIQYRKSSAISVSHHEVQVVEAVAGEAVEAAAVETADGSVVVATALACPPTRFVENLQMPFDPDTASFWV